MPKLAVLIIDDEPIQRKIMRQHCVQSRCFETIHEASDAVQALEMLHQTTYDLLLLDINMPLLSGLNLVKSVKQNINVIFVTAYAEHAVEAFELNVVDYLLKPVSFERFIKAIQKILPTEKAAIQQEVAASKTTFISLKQGKKTIKVNIEDILYCEAKGNNTWVYLADETHLDIYSPLTKMLTDLPAENFMRVHRSFIVNSKRIKAIENNLLHIGSTTIPIGANYKEEIRKAL